MYNNSASAAGACMHVVPKEGACRRCLYTYPCCQPCVSLEGTPRRVYCSWYGAAAHHAAQIHSVLSLVSYQSRLTQLRGMSLHHTRSVEWAGLGALNHGPGGQAWPEVTCIALCVRLTVAQEVCLSRRGLKSDVLPSVCRVRRELWSAPFAQASWSLRTWRTPCTPTTGEQSSSSAHIHASNDHRSQV